MATDIPLNNKIEMPLDSLIKIERKSGGGKYKGGKRYSPRKTSSGPYTPRKRRSSSPKNGSANGTRVYVGNLPWSTTWQDLKDHMKQAGTVSHADILMEDGSGRSKGCGIVEYSSSEEAKKAIDTLNETTLPGTDRKLFVREDREEGSSGRTEIRGEKKKRSFSGGANSKQGDQGRQVFVGNLPYDVSWQDLKDKFRRCGNVIRADVLQGPDGRSKGSGTVLFETKFEAKKAIQMFDSKDFQGRPIAVRLDKFV